MSTGLSTKKPDISFASGVRSGILSWTSAAGGALAPVKLQFRRLVLGIRKHASVIFALLLTAGIMEFNYYQARLTRDYLRAFLVSAAQMNGDIDALDAKLNQLNIKIDAMGAKLDNLGARLDKLSAPPPAPQSKPRPSIFPRFR
jgi:hypothetical protein